MLAEVANDTAGLRSSGPQDLKSVQAAPLPPMIAPLRFAIVAQIPETQTASTALSNGENATGSSQSVYRGSFPRSRHLFFLRRLRIKTILSLTPKPIESVDKEVSEWCEKHNVTVRHIRCDKPKDDGGGLSRENAAKALTHVLDKRNLPLYIHCLDGLSVSTLLVAVLRKVQAWSTAAIQNEMVRALGQDEDILTYQLGFVDRFGKPEGVRLPPRRFMPDWTWQDPSPLRRLRNPYDVIAAPTKDKQQEKAVSLISEDHRSSHKRQLSTDAVSVSSSSGGVISPYGSGSLPVQHPTLKLRFDVDNDLPPPPAQINLSTTPSLGHSRESSTFLSPSPSRPASRAGRAHSHHNAHIHTTHHPHHHQYTSTSSTEGARSRASSRASSRPGSPPGSRRREVQTTPDAYRVANDAAAAAAAYHQSPDRAGAPNKNTSASGSLSAISHSSPVFDNDFRLPAAARLTSQALHNIPTQHVMDYQHQPQVHSHLNDVFYSSASQTVTPRASFSHAGAVAARPQSLFAGDLVTGLGLRNTESAASHAPSAGLLQPPTSWPAGSHPVLARSVSDRQVGSSDAGGRESDSYAHSNDADHSEYFSEPGSGDEQDPAGRQKRLSRHSDEATPLDDGNADEEEIIDEIDEEETDGIGEGEEELDEVLSEQEDEEDDDDDLALEALDLEGY